MLTLLVLVGCGDAGLPLEPNPDSRIHADTCTGERPPTEGFGGFEGLPEWTGCGTDADCVDGPQGRCVRAGAFRGECTYHDCTSSSDCDVGQTCVCAAGVAARNRCVPDECDGVCGDEYCILDVACGGVLRMRGPSAVACQSTEDECRQDSDCAEREFCTRRDGSGRRPYFYCDPTGCAVP